MTVRILPIRHCLCLVLVVAALFNKQLINPKKSLYGNIQITVSLLRPLAQVVDAFGYVLGVTALMQLLCIVLVRLLPTNAHVFPRAYNLPKVPGLNSELWASVQGSLHTSHSPQSALGQVIYGICTHNSFSPPSGEESAIS